MSFVSSHDRPIALNGPAFSHTTTGNVIDSFTEIQMPGMIRAMKAGIRMMRITM